MVQSHNQQRSTVSVSSKIGIKRSDTDVWHHRLSVWATIFVVLFRCPSTSEEIGPESPRVCAPYFQARNAILPHVQPYYYAYAAPYVERARPYADRAYDTVLLPSFDFAQHNYQVYGAPRLEQAKIYSQEQWEHTLKPQLENGRSSAVQAYRGTLGPQVDAIVVKAEPYYTNARNTAGQQYQAIVLPAYEKTRPYVVNGYEQGSRFASDVALPYGQWVAINTATFVQRRIWPPIRILYGQNVQPQLVKIQERLANYRDSKSIEAAMESEASSASSSLSSSSSSVSRSAASSATSVARGSASTQLTSVSSTSSSVTPSSTVAPENILDDLELWKNKFNRAAEEGAQGLRERIGEIADKQIKDQSQGTGDPLVTSLEEAAKSSISSLKADIISIVSALPSDDAKITTDQYSKAKDEARDAVRVAGKAIKDKAQKLRSWRRSFNEETQRLIDSAADSTLDVVDSIREAGLQEIGMRWASMEGVTYKDWSEYHSMRKSFDQWRDTLQAVVSDHSSPQKARKAAEEVESRGMAVAEDAAKELARLKDVASWKSMSRCQHS